MRAVLRAIVEKAELYHRPDQLKVSGCRGEAKRSITHAEAVEAMKDVVFGVRQGDYDEMPQAYKDIHAVMGNQADLVEAVDLLHPLAVVKG